MRVCYVLHYIRHLINAFVQCSKCSPLRCGALVFGIGSRLLRLNCYQFSASETVQTMICVRSVK